MFQSRTTPYFSTELNFQDPCLNKPGRYCGRILESEWSTSSSRILVLFQDHYSWISLEEPLLAKQGEVIAFDLSGSGTASHLEVLSSCQTPSLKEALRWRSLGKSPSRMVYLKSRHHILQSIRSFFDQSGFLEVHTPLWVKAPNPEHQFEYFSTGDGFLITSPEFHMKRMLVGGFEKIYQLGSCFRKEEVSPIHHSEFTMLEWYRAYDRLETIVTDTEKILLLAQESVSRHVVNFPEMKALSGDWKSPFSCYSVTELFTQHLGISLDSIDSASELLQVAWPRYQHFLKNTSGTYESIFFRLWNLIEPLLGHSQPVWVYNWPLPLGSLAQKRLDQPQWVERAELYVSGVELANGFGELIDAQEQRHRFELELAQRRQLNLPEVPLDEAFLEALKEGLPPSAGISMGIDRLVMLVTGASSIGEVLSFSQEEI